MRRKKALATDEKGMGGGKMYGSQGGYKKALVPNIMPLSGLLMPLIHEPPTFVQSKRSGYRNSSLPRQAEWKC